MTEESFTALTDLTIRNAVITWTINSTNATLIYGPISQWNTSLVTSMVSLFSNLESFDEDLSQWDTSRVTSLNSMFRGAKSFNHDLSLWDTSKVEDLSSMFYAASSFNGDISLWNISSATDMRAMFAEAELFNRDLSLWNTARVMYTISTFRGAYSFDGNLSHWNTSAVVDMNAMFFAAFSFNRPLSSWDTSRVTNMSRMFWKANLFNQSLCWDTSNVPDSGKEYMFFSSGLLLPYPQCRPNPSPTAKPSKRTSFRPFTSPLPDSQVAINIWPDPWITHTSPVYGRMITNLTENVGICPPGSKIVRVHSWSTNEINQLSAHCDDESQTMLGPWGYSRGASTSLPLCVTGYNSCNISYATYIRRLSFSCAKNNSTPQSIGIVFDSVSTDSINLLWNQSIIGIRVFYNILGVHAISIFYADLPYTGRCHYYNGLLTGRCPKRNEWLAIVWGFLTLGCISFAVSGTILYSHRRRHKKHFRRRDAILPLK